MVVMKFGGTSVEDPAAMLRVIGIVKQQAERIPLVVTSACAGVTNELIHLSNTVLAGHEMQAIEMLDKLRYRHLGILGELVSKENRPKSYKFIDEIFQDLGNLIKGVYLLGELTNRSLDTIVSYGERLSSFILSIAMEETGLPVVLVDARRVMITDKNYSAAQPLLAQIEVRATEVFQPLIDEGKIIVTQGFIGSAEDGSTTTIGRGGSDFSAAIFGSVLGAKEIQIWTDVDGMMTSDPRIVLDAKRIDVITFDEASELAYFGAKVLHPNTILPAVKRNIPVRVLNSKRPELEGTLIVEQTTAADQGNVTSIASKKGIIVINVTSSRMLLAHGFLSKLFTIFAEHQKSVDVVSTSEVSVSLTVDNDSGLAEIQKELEEIGEVRIEKTKAIICIVGVGMKHKPGMAARIFNTLASFGINIEMISEGASEINLTLVVDDQVVDEAVRVLHKDLF
jgi:aspartate kinase